MTVLGSAVKLFFCSMEDHHVSVLQSLYTILSVSKVYCISSFSYNYFLRNLSLKLSKCEMFCY